TQLRRSPAHLKAYLDQPPADALALKIGRAAHTAILEPDEFSAQFAVAGQCEAIKTSDGRRCTNSGILFREEKGWLCGVHGKGLSSDETRTVLSADDYAACLGMRDAVHANPAARALLTRLDHVELSMVWADAESAVLCKARPDGLALGFADGVMVDIKSTRDARERPFERAIEEHGYHRQGAFYLTGAAVHQLAVSQFVNIAVEKEPPYANVVYCLKPDAIALGRRQLARLLATYRECMEREVFPGYPARVVDIGVPAWALAELDDSDHT